MHNTKLARQLHPSRHGDEHLLAGIGSQFDDPNLVLVPSFRGQYIQRHIPHVPLQSIPPKI